MICLDKRFCLFVSEHTSKYVWGFTLIYLFFFLLGPSFVLVSQNLADAETEDKSGAFSERSLLFWQQEACRRAVLSRASEVGAFGAVTPRSDPCLSRDWQVKISWPISGSALSFASRAVPTHLALQPVLFRGMISRTLHARVHPLLHTSLPEQIHG